MAKKNHAKAGMLPKTTSFFVKKRSKKTTPFRIRNSLVKTFSQYSESPSLRGDSRINPIKIKFYFEIINSINSGLLQFINKSRNDEFVDCNDD